MSDDMTPHITIKSTYKVYDDKENLGMKGRTLSRANKQLFQCFTLKVKKKSASAVCSLHFNNIFQMCDIAVAASIMPICPQT